MVRNVPTVVLLSGMIAACSGKAELSQGTTPEAGSDVGGGAGAPEAAGGTAGRMQVGDAGAAAAGDPIVSGAGAAGSHAEGGDAGSLPSSPDAARILTTAATDGEWYGKDPTHGLVLISDRRVLLQTSYKIHQIQDSVVSDYFTDIEAQAAFGTHNTYGFGDLGQDARGTLYATYAGSILRWNVTQSPQLWRTLPGTENAPALRIAVLGPDDVLAISKDGIWRVTGQAAAVPLKTLETSADTCPYPDFVLADSGTFLFRSDCSMATLQRGFFDGSQITGLETKYATAFPPSGSSAPAQFLCMSAAPAGGFYVVIKQTGSVQLYYLREDATQADGAIKISVSPSLDGAAAMTTDKQTLEFCKLAATADGALYLQTSKLLWRMSEAP